KMFEAHQKIKAAQRVSPGFGMIIERYDTTVGPAMFLLILSPPKRRSKGKRKDYEKALQKSIQQGKVFSSKDFVNTQLYFTSVFSSNITPHDKILEQLQTILAGLILGFVPFQNVKYTVKSHPGVKIALYDTVLSGQYTFLFSIVGMKEDGLYLAHENQIAFIRQEINSGKNPNFIRNIPSLQKGPVHTPQKSSPQKPDRAADHQAIKKFRKRLKQKKDGVQIQEELEYETVIDFASQQSSDIQSNHISSDASPTPGDPESLGNKSRPAPLPHPAAIPIPVPKIIPDSFSGFHPQVVPPETRDVDSEINKLQTQLTLITDSLTQQLAEKDTDILSYQDKIEKMEEKLGQSQNSNKKITQENLDMQAKIQENDNQIAHLKDNNNGFVRTVQILEQKNHELTAQLQDAAHEADERYHQTMSEKLNLEIIVTEMQEELADLRREIDKNAGTTG
ncbi:MAG: hypothetical protein KAR20_02210, partial [Candidatus Heimdallarchaeota archaeon]|nr:hypothetical protein [Candidatus Heimdallarchaeota archaeon]